MKTTPWAPLAVPRKLCRFPRYGARTLHRIEARRPHPAHGDAVGALCQECVQELHMPRPDYAKVLSLAAVGLVAELQDVGNRFAELSHQVMLASWR